MKVKTVTNSHCSILYIFYKLKKCPELVFKAFGVTAILFFYSGSIVAESELTLRFDPFQRSPLKSERQAVSGGNQPIRTKTWNPKLHATLVAGKNSMVNVGGTSIQVGEKYQGYRLVKVRNSSAVFVKTPHKIELTIK